MGIAHQHYFLQFQQREEMKSKLKEQQVGKGTNFKEIFETLPLKLGGLSEHSVCVGDKHGCCSSIVGPPIRHAIYDIWYMIYEDMLSLQTTTNTTTTTTTIISPHVFFFFDQRN